MATVTGRRSLNKTILIEVDGDPSAAAGTPAPTGSVALVVDGSGLWWKAGAGDVDWVEASEALTFSAPLSRTGDTVSIPKATAAVDGYLDSADFATFEGKENVLSFTPPLSRLSNTVSLPAASSSSDGYLTSAAWSNFNQKLDYPGALWPGGDARPIVMLSGTTANAVDESNISQSESTGDISIGASVDVTGGITATGAIAASGNLSTLLSLTVGATTTTQNLTVNGSSEFHDVIDITGFGGALNTVTINGVDGQTGYALLIRNHLGANQAAIGVDGAIFGGFIGGSTGTFSSNVSVGGTLSVTGLATANGGITVNGLLDANESADIRTVDTTTPTLILRKITGQTANLLTVLNESSVTKAYIDTVGTVFGTGLLTDGTMQSNHIVVTSGGTTTLNGTLDVTGLGTFSGGLTASASATVTGTLTVNGTGAIIATSINVGSVEATHLESLDTLTVDGLSTLTGGVTSSGTASFATLVATVAFQTDASCPATFLDTATFHDIVECRNLLRIGSASQAQLDYASGLNVAVDGSTVMTVQSGAVFFNEAVSFFGGVSGGISMTTAGGRSLTLNATDSGNFAHVGTTSAHDFYLVRGGTQYMGLESGEVVFYQNIKVRGLGDVGLHLEADTNNVGEEQVAYIRMSQDNDTVFHVIGGVGNAGEGPNGLTVTGTIANALYICNSFSSGGIQFGDHNSVQMTLLPTGELGLGDTSPSFQLELSTNSAAKPTSNVWTIVSDERVKKDVVDYRKGLDVIERIRPVEYTYNGAAGFKAGERGIGIVAQEIMQVLPETVRPFHKKVRLNATDVEETDLYAFDGHALTFVLINAVKELSALLKQQETKIQALERRPAA